MHATPEFVPVHVLRSYAVDCGCDERFANRVIRQAVAAGLLANGSVRRNANPYGAVALTTAGARFVEALLQDTKGEINQ